MQHGGVFDQEGNIVTLLNQFDGLHSRRGRERRKRAREDVARAVKTLVAAGNLVTASEASDGANRVTNASSDHLDLIQKKM
jgi:hypothetical protein